eukprot:TCONS_00066961-protein
MGYNGVANLALVIILLKCVTVLSESVSFERKQNVDIFKNNGRKCYQMAASVYEQGWCKCDFEKMFVGDKCVVKRTMSACIMAQVIDVVNLNIADINYITVLDFNFETKESFWNYAFSDNIIKLISESQGVSTNLKVELAGMIMKIALNGNPQCMMVKILGPSRYPVDLSHLGESNTESDTASKKKYLPEMATTTSTTTDVLKTLESQQPNNQDTENNMFNSTTGIIVSTIAALTLILLVVAIILFKRSKMKRRRNDSAASIETPEIASVCSLSSKMDPTFCSPALSRHSLETIITDGSDQESQNENIYQQPDDVVKSNSYKRHSNIPAAYFQQISLDYENPDDVRQQVENLSPEYHELEIEDLQRRPMPQRRNDEINDDNVQQWKPKLPRKPTILQNIQSNRQLLNNGSFESDEDYYSEALGTPNQVSPDQFEELYAKVDKSRKRQNNS